MAQQPVPFPVALDKFGTELQNAIIAFQKGGVLKTALISDIVKLYGAVFWMQQLLATFYNGHAQDYIFFSKNSEELKKKLGDLETRVAGYSERINILEADLRKVNKNNLDELIKNLKENGEFRQLIKQALI